MERSCRTSTSSSNSNSNGNSNSTVSGHVAADHTGPSVDVGSNRNDIQYTAICFPDDGAAKRFGDYFKRTGNNSYHYEV